MTQSFTLSLSDAQLDRIVAAMQRQRSLTAEQQAMAEAIGAVGSNMGLATFSPQRPGLVRRGDVVEITPPAGTASVRVYTTRGVEERAIDPSARELALRGFLGNDDRIGRLEYLGPDGRILGATGAEIRQP
jgi:hypothetical protein